MKVSLQTIRHLAAQYGTSKDPFDYGVYDIISRIGYQLGAIEDVEYFGKKYDGIVVARVVSCEQHPDADKLKVCMIDDDQVVPNVERNEDGFVQVVCGAPNVAVEQIVAWIPPGMTVPSTVDHDPFVLEARAIRGQVSNGMLASPKELGLGENHEGILVINPEDVGEDLSKPGRDFKRLYGIDDVIIDCENKMFTHRPDCFGIMGVAREISGIFGDQFTSPEWYVAPSIQETETSLPLQSQNDILDMVPRFSIRAMSDVTVMESPMWLQAFLARVGQKSINNIVDYTNFFMFLTGQPLHAFDYDKVAALCEGDPMLFPRMAVSGEKLTLLNGKMIELTDQDIVIATDKGPVALGGVMGGADTEVDENTQNIIIECANFDMYAIRRTSMRHGIFSDAVTRFNKGQSPLQNIAALTRMVQEVQNFAGGKVASDLIDIAGFNKEDDNLTRVETTVDFINSRLGSQLSSHDIKKLLENVEFVVAIDGPDSSKLLITAPFWRMDIVIAEDIVEEVGRLYSYDNLPVTLPPRSSKPAQLNELRVFRQGLRDVLVKAGANEVLTYSFVHARVMESVGVDPDKWAFHLRNALSPDLQYYRTALVPSLLTKVHSNLKAGAGDDQNEFALFEFGKVHIKDHTEENSDLPKQMRRLAGVVAADEKTAKKYSGSAYYHAKKYLDRVTNGQAVYEPLTSMEYPITAAYAKGRSAMVKIGEEVLGVVGEFHAKARKGFKLPDYCAGFELDVDLLSQHLKPSAYTPLSPYPDTSQDITLEIDSDMTWRHVYDFVHAEVAVGAAEDDLDYDVQPLDIFQPDESAKKRISFRINLTHHKKTLKTEEVNALLDHVERQAKETLKATRI